MHAYTRRFFEKCATVTNIPDQDVIDCFQQGLTDRYLFRDFGQQRPKTIGELRDMMAVWADNEEQENDSYPTRGDEYNDNKQSSNNSNKGQREYSDSSKKRKPDDHVAALECPPRGKKNTTQEQFQMLLQKKCPFHLDGKHTAIDCWNLKKAIGGHPPDINKKKKKTKMRKKTRKNPKS